MKIDPITAMRDYLNHLFSDVEDCYNGEEDIADKFSTILSIYYSGIVPILKELKLAGVLFVIEHCTCIDKSCTHTRTSMRTLYNGLMRLRERIVK